MRPLLLSLSAFGPFPATETVDFTRLGENPLFLINGPTGAGKTTILDAICFALYGKTTGDEREGTQMRSDRAAAETLCEVTLTFELAGRTYRIRRVPEQPRPKARGEGTTTQAPEAQLHELCADGSERLIVASKVSEATREIEELTGLSVDQFRQVMVLPQGKFRQLLLAESHEREKIFSQLFQTRIYKRLEERLKDEAAGIRRKREEQLQLQQGMLEGADLASVAELEQELSACKTDGMTAKAELDASETALAAAEKALLLGQNVAQDFVRLEKVTGELSTLEGERASIEGARARLARAEQASRIAPVFADRVRCESEYGQAKADAEDAATLLGTAQKALEEVIAQRQASTQLQADLQQANQEVSRLQGYRERVTRLATARICCDEAGHLAAQADLVLRFKLLADRFLTIHNRDRKQQEFNRQQEVFVETQGREEALRHDHREQEQVVKRLELAWHQGQAAILARELREGSPCPVCGSTAHPSPARAEDELPDQNQLEQARAAVQRAAEALETGRQQTLAAQEILRDFERDLKVLHEAISGDSSLDRLREEIARLQEEAKRSAIVLPDRERIPQLALDELHGEREKTHGAAVAARAQLETAEQELPEAYRAQGTLDAAITVAAAASSRIEGEIRNLEESYQKATNAKIAAQSTLDAATGQLQKTETARGAAQQRAVEVLATSPFDTEDALRAALLDATALTRLQEQLTSFDRNFAELTGMQKQLNEQLQGVARPHLESLRAVRDEAEASRNLARDAWTTLDKRLATLTATQAKLAKAAADCAELDRQYAVIGTLSDVANGQTGDKISLQRFVLSVLLDDVLIEASRRLALMSKGRYQLLRKEERAKGNKASGLELEVEDAYTGKVRPVATLSGGESFMAALALALGLSDVVQAYAGGIRLDALFVDEGFGSLDSESLDLAIRTLVDLQATGRMVGIISHVAELKEQIPLRLDVLMERDGSRIALINPYQ